MTNKTKKKVFSETTIVYDEREKNKTTGLSYDEIKVGQGYVRDGRIFIKTYDADGQAFCLNDMRVEEGPPNCWPDRKLVKIKIIVEEL